ncbi:MAG: VWA domain-containing protein [Hyphomicrobiaceae bacterium]|nr:VWA domain-containing protein [Hyphomicrobiaceae bacterium]
MLEQAVTNFHLLRPWWLVGLVPIALILFVLQRRDQNELQWTGAIAPNLLKYMTVTPEKSWHIRPAWLVASVLALAIIALAGPSWRRELPPFVEDKAPLMIALDVSGSMGGTDVAPSRLERAKQKILDLLATRGNARTGLIAFAGSAHLVMPLTDDRRVIEPFLASLSPALMPVPGKDPVAAVDLAAKSLADEIYAGTILIVSDDLGNAAATDLERAAGRNGLLMLAVIPADKAHSPIDDVQVTVDTSDIEAITRRINTHFQSTEADLTGARWMDEGFWLLLPIALISLLWFRRGVSVQWALLFILLLPTTGHAETAGTSWRFANLWLTPDQQGRIAFDRGDYHRAAQLFADPMWRGIAAYRAYDFIEARDAFRKIDTVQGRFALGNAEAQNHAYETAIKLYQEVLAQQPDNEAAKTNLTIVRAAYEAAEAKRRKEEQGEPDQPLYKTPDGTKLDKQQKGGKRMLVNPQDLTTPGAAEAWMREVQTTPADFLKLKFAIQAQADTKPAATGGSK